MKAQRTSRGNKSRSKNTGVPKKRIAPKLRIWVVFDERVKFGDGRAQLLELIGQLGSIKNAVEHNGMSYRAVWGYLKELESAAGFKFLERTPGSGPHSGARLTEEAKAFLRSYRRFRDRMERTMESAFRRSFHPA